MARMIDEAMQTLEAAAKDSGVRLPRARAARNEELEAAIEAHKKGGRINQEAALKSLEGKLGLTQAGERKRQRTDADADDDHPEDQTKAKPAKQARKAGGNNDAAGSGDGAGASGSSGASGDKREQEAEEEGRKDEDECRVPENHNIAHAFTELANHIFRTQDSEDDIHRAIGYRKVAKSVRAHSKPITNPPKPGDIPGIGPSSCEKIKQFLDEGKIDLLEELKGQPDRQVEYKVEENRHIADAFSELADGEFRVEKDVQRGIAYRKMAKVIRELEHAITEAPKPGEVPGIGKSGCDKIKELLEKGKIQKLEELKKH